MKAAAIIVAGGSGKRFGSKKPKQFLTLAGKPMFMRSVETFAGIKEFKQIILVVPKQYLKTSRSKKHITVEGGKERFNSVQNGLAAVSKDIDFIAVHDAARPLISKRDILAVLNKAAKCSAAIVVEKTKDTIKTAKNNFVTGTLDRTLLWNVQTPQIFKAGLLKKVYSKKISTKTTDDSMLVEKAGVKVAIVETTSPNFKITTQQDFELAKLILKRKG